MLSPEYLETLPDAVVKLWQQVEDDILRDVARRIGSLDDLDPMTPTAQWQAWRLDQARLVRGDVTGTLAKYSGKTKAEIRRLLQDAGTQALAADDAVYRAAGKSPAPVNASPALLNLLNSGYRQTLGSWQNLTATTARTVTGEFERAMDRAWLQVSSGAFDHKTAIARAVDDLAAGGLKAITYPTGHRDTLEVAVRRCVLTGTNQTAAKLQIARMDEMECEFVEVTAHEGARPEHAVWQGKVYHRSGAVELDGVKYEDFETATGYGTGPGLCGWNCRHNFYPFFPGVSTRNYTDQRLAELADPEAYALRQQQRALERKVRDAKRRFIAADAAGADTGKAAARLKSACRELAQFLKENGLRQDSSRERVQGFGYQQARTVSAAEKAYTKSKNDAIMIENLRSAGNLPRTAKIHLPPAEMDMDSLSFDDKHINGQRHHNITEEQAKHYIQNAAFSATVWGGQFERYYGIDGVAYVDIRANSIRTAFGKAEFDESLKNLVEEMKQNGLLGER